MWVRAAALFSRVCPMVCDSQNPGHHRSATTQLVANSGGSRTCGGVDHSVEAQRLAQGAVGPVRGLAGWDTQILEGHTQIFWPCDGVDHSVEICV